MNAFPAHPELKRACLRLLRGSLNLRAFCVFTFSLLTSVERLVAAAGDVDVAFNFGPYYYSISSLALQPDGKLLMGGYFNNLLGLAKMKEAMWKVAPALDRDLLATGDL